MHVLSWFCFKNIGSVENSDPVRKDDLATRYVENLQSLCYFRYRRGHDFGRAVVYTFRQRNIVYRHYCRPR